MSPDTFRVVLVVATTVGFFMTAGGLVAAYINARGELRKAEARIVDAKRLGEEEDLETDAANALPDAERDVALPAIHAKYEAAYLQADLIRASWDNIGYDGIAESRRLLRLLLSSTRDELLVAGGGLLVSTLASIGSLFI